MMNEIIGYDDERIYDNHGNLLHYKYTNGYEDWYIYDEKSRRIYTKCSNGFERWEEYYDEFNLGYLRDNNGKERWFKYTEGYSWGDKISQKEFEWIKFKKKEKEFNSREKVSRFRLMDI